MYGDVRPPPSCARPEETGDGTVQGHVVARCTRLEEAGAAEVSEGAALWGGLRARSATGSGAGGTTLHLQVAYACQPKDIDEELLSWPASSSFLPASQTHL